MRIESVVAVQAAEQEGWLKYDRLTQVPIDKRLVDFGLLDKSERNWLEAHNQDVKRMLLPMLDKSETLAKEWLERV